MKARKSRVAVLIVAAAAAAAAAGLTAYYYAGRTTPHVSFEGWVEAEFVFVSPDETGRVEKLSVREGDHIAAGAPLFALDDDLQRAAVAENEATVINARHAYDRAQELLKRAVGTQKTFDEAQAVLRSAEARLNSAKTRLDRRRMASPAMGVVQEVYYREGEMVQAGRPIVSLLPPGNIKVRFFVPQAVLPTLHIGDRINVHCDGCTETLAARVRFLSAQAEFTPPIIYSQEERARLVFRVEAWPENADVLRVGQPVTVTLASSPVISHAQQ